MPVERGFTRRDVLRLAGSLGLSFALPPLDPLLAARRGRERPKSLLILWLAGGPSQLETWDPHPGTRFGGPTTAIDTTVRGLRIAGWYPRIAERMHHLSVIRSLVSKEGDHERGTYFVKTGYRPVPKLVHPSLGAIVTHELPDDRLEIPAHVSLGGGPWPARGGFLGNRYDAFRIFNPGRNVQNMKARVGPNRQQRRLRNLDVVSRSFRQGREWAAERTLHRETIERALTMMSSEQLRAFEIDDEPQQRRDAYGDTQFGRGCLVARRLIEQGVRAIEVTLTGWDSHADNFTAHEQNAAVLDPALSALVDDLVERDLWDSTVLLCIGEFGRTPKINPLDGRDHWPMGFSCLIGGGGLRSGVVIGQTDPDNDDPKRPPADPVEVPHLFATILAAMGVDFTKEIVTPIGRPIALCDDGTPLAALLPEFAQPAG